MRMAILLSALVATAALADNPPAASADAAKTTTAATTTEAKTAATSTTATTPAPSAETIKKARQLGLIPRKRKGKTMYCRDVADIGTRFTTEHCYDEENLDVIMRELQASHDEMERSHACGGAACGAQ